MKNIDIIFGLHASISALNNKKRKLIEILCTDDTFKRVDKILIKHQISNVQFVTRKYLDTILKNKYHQGIMIKSYKLEQRNYDEILESYKSSVLILDSLTDTQNVGSIIRSAYLFGISLIFYNDKNSFDINSSLIKSASGAFEKVNLIKAGNLNNLIEYLKGKKYWIFGLDLKSKMNVSEIPNNLKKVIILGSENKGIRPLIKKNCDHLVKIPMKKNNEIIDSLNISNAAAIMFYELSKL